jgi:hypothetical protein
MESLSFPMDLLGLGFVTGIAMRAMIRAPSGGHARKRSTTTRLLHEVAVRRNTSQADQPARSCLLTPLPISIGNMSVQFRERVPTKNWTNSLQTHLPLCMLSDAVTAMLHRIIVARFQGAQGEKRERERERNREDGDGSVLLMGFAFAAAAEAHSLGTVGVALFGACDAVLERSCAKRKWGTLP